MSNFFKFCGIFLHKWEVVDKRILHRFHSTEERNTDHWADAHDFYDITYQCSVCKKVSVDENVPVLKEYRRKKKV